MTCNSGLVGTTLWAIVATTAVTAPANVFAQSSPVTQRETAVAPEINPPGDIPDDQVFITYKSPGGFSMQVPEGWSRSDAANGVSFADKYGRIVIDVTPAEQAPTAASIKQKEVVGLVASGHAVDVKDIRTMPLPAGEAVAVDYLSNSAVNPVTDRKIRLENRRIYYFRNGKKAVLTLSAPAGADNVDQWKMMAESFRWSS
ncbi:hypothetical protein [Aurantimonas marina]|uniref:hypothetical protein n=1 Tax=Aurantimonas marina TaxID=2780508 RepID=UPI0019D282F2|nr:hypothetical protein [Aurantimonas marina]